MTLPVDSTILFLFLSVQISRDLYVPLQITMKLAWKIFRAIAVVLLVLAVALPASLYVLLSTDPVQNEVRDTASRELSRILGVQVDIDTVSIHPFNRLSIKGVRIIRPAESDTVASIETISAGFELYHFIRTGELIIDYALVDNANFNIRRPDKSSPVNLEEILSHIKKDRRSGRQSSFHLKINTVILRNSSLSYDVLSEPEPEAGKFDPNHIEISDFELNAYIPDLSPDKYDIELEHLSFSERSGFELRRIKSKTSIGHQGLVVSEFSIELPESHFSLKPMELHYDGYADIPRAMSETPLVVGTSSRSRIYPPDLEAFLPALKHLNRPFSLEFDLRLGNKSAEIGNFTLSDSEGGAFALRLRGEARKTDEGYEYNLENCTAAVDGEEVGTLLSPYIKQNQRNTIKSIVAQAISLKAQGNQDKGHIILRTDGTAGELNLNASYSVLPYKSVSLRGNASFKDLNIGLISGNPELSLISGKIEGNGRTGHRPEGEIKVEISELDFHGYTYSDIDLTADLEDKRQLEVRIDINDPSAIVHAYTLYTDNDEGKRLQATATVANVDFNVLGFDQNRADYRFGAKLNTDLDITDFSRGHGFIRINDIRWLDSYNRGLRINDFTLKADSKTKPATIDIDSDILKGSFVGDYAFAALIPQLKHLASHFVPALLSSPSRNVKSKVNDFRFNFTLLPSENVSEFFGLPIHIVHDSELQGAFDSQKGRAYLSLDVPYLRNGDKLIEGTSLYASMDSKADRSYIYFTSQIPTNKGAMALTGLVKGANNIIDTQLDWMIERKIPLNGTMSFSTEILPKPEQKEKTMLCPIPLIVNFNPGTINFGDETWNIKKSRISVGREIRVDGFGLDTDGQSIAIDGTAGHDEDDNIIIDLHSIALLPIFETLEIDKAMIGGRATGRFSARRLLSSTPELFCPKLHVDSIGYNRCTIGDADIEASWDNNDKAFAFDADITGLKGDKSRIAGKIFPMGEALDIDFDASHVPVGFLKPFMEAFASDIEGHASGHCRLFGTFKEIDLEGQVMAEDVKMKIDFTNTWYAATDSVYMTPGVIRLSDVTIHDTEGHTALLDGIVRHTYFKEPVFKFDITHAQNFLSFNATPKQYPDWYGTIYGNGGASISGYPGVVDIKVNMATAPHSTFTFVLSDRLDAESYSFLNFRDATPDTLHATEKHNDTPAIIRELKKRIKAANTDEPSAYNMDLQIDVTKDAQMILVMDPMAGDEIKALGEGHLHLAYQSVDNSLNIWGSYKVLSGSYLFTLQDIIIRDFTIKEGSEIRFDGDPYAVKTNLQAYYATNANLSDLDESFLQDKEVSRTNVPVHALMLVSGDIRQPSIDFDLEFPTLTSDTYRKVRSIVSTSDMMNRQIIYLLALNRFYTPDYMASTTKGSELFSVASSTISSQLGNMLGKLSDNWSIAPNLRSDRGDFSDVEVDVALSSRLLNNRLLFNGNFGYRDKSLNTNQFIGDFDIEYLLNKRGSWRLKAYNRYNDRSFYVRSAQTTQGVGIVFRRDFDDFLSFLRKFRNKTAAADTTNNDSHSKR